MYGTARVENRKRTFRKENKQRNRAIKRLSTTTPYISSGSNALTIAGGLAQYYQIQYVVAAQKLGRAKFRGCEKSQGGLDSEARQQSVTPSPSEWEGQPPNRAKPFSALRPVTTPVERGEDDEWEEEIHHVPCGTSPRVW